MCLICKSLFAIPPVPDWARNRWVNPVKKEAVKEVEDPSLIFHYPKCPPFLCIKHKERRKKTWDPKMMRKSNKGIQAITQRNYKLRDEVRMRWINKGAY